MFTFLEGVAEASATVLPHYSNMGDMNAASPAPSTSMAFPNNPQMAAGGIITVQNTGLPVSSGPGFMVPSVSRTGAGTVPMQWSQSSDIPTQAYTQLNPVPLSRSTTVAAPPLQTTVDMAALGTGPQVTQPGLQPLPGDQAAQAIIAEVSKDVADKDDIMLNDLTASGTMRFVEEHLQKNPGMSLDNINLSGLSGLSELSGLSGDLSQLVEGEVVLQPGDLSQVVDGEVIVSEEIVIDSSGADQGGGTQ